MAEDSGLILELLLEKRDLYDRQLSNVNSSSSDSYRDSNGPRIRVKLARVNAEIARRSGGPWRLFQLPRTGART
jgi:hypothetical protein